MKWKILLDKCICQISKGGGLAPVRHIVIVLLLVFSLILGQGLDSTDVRSLL